MLTASLGLRGPWMPKGDINHHPKRARRTCPMCKTVFTRQSNYCSDNCRNMARHDIEYFGGLRTTAVGFKERQCWVCGKIGLKRINVHHVMGKANSHVPLVVLCPGCHQLITRLSHRLMLEDAHKVADLITLCRFEAGLEDAKTVLKYKYNKGGTR